MRDVAPKQTALAKSVYVKGGARGIAEKIKSKVTKSVIGGEQAEETVFDLLDELSQLVEDLIGMGGPHPGQQNHGQYSQSVLE